LTHERGNGPKAKPAEADHSQVSMQKRTSQFMIDGEVSSGMPISSTELHARADSCFDLIGTQEARWGNGSGRTQMPLVLHHRSPRTLGGAALDPDGGQRWLLTRRCRRPLRGKVSKRTENWPKVEEHTFLHVWETPCLASKARRA